MLCYRNPSAHMQPVIKGLKHIHCNRSLHRAPLTVCFSILLNVYNICGKEKALMTGILSTGHSERPLNTIYTQSCLPSDVYTTEHLLNAWQIELNATLAAKFNFSRRCWVNSKHNGK